MGAAGRRWYATPGFGTLTPAVRNVPSLLVTNDFPPKTGGIQTYLWELWRRLPPDEITVLTTGHAAAGPFDEQQPFRIERVDRRVLLPTRALAKRIDALAREVGAGVIFVDPALPLGFIGPRLTGAPYVVIVHGAEVTVPRRLPGLRPILGRVLRGAAGIVAAGEYPAEEAERAAGRPLPKVLVPPGVDVERFQPLAGHDKAAVLARFGMDPGVPVVLGVSRLVPRKGFDVLIDAVAGLEVPVQLVIAGTGRDGGRLRRRAEARGIAGRTHFVGFVSDEELPLLYGSADVFAMLCRDRWGGMEQEGFGIVFLEAAACGVPSIAGRSGGSHEAVIDGETGFVVPPRDVDAVREAIRTLLSDSGCHDRMGRAARARVEREFNYDRLAERLRLPACGDFSTMGFLSENGAGG